MDREHTILSIEKMHVCRHDAHAIVVFGATKLLYKHKDKTLGALQASLKGCYHRGAISQVNIEGNQ